MASKRKWLVWIVGAAVLLLALPFLLSLLRWSPINCWHYDVDIYSGRVRYTRYLAFTQIFQRIDESTLSRALQPADSQAFQPEWRRALTLSPGVRNSPHYAFHSAISQIRELEIIWEFGDFTPAARHSSARRVLELWRQGQSDDAAKPYLQTISEIAFRSSSQGKSTDELDLPAGR